MRTGDGEQIETEHGDRRCERAGALREFIDAGICPRRLLDDIRRFQWDAPTMKIDWVLSDPVPWTAEDARGAGRCTSASTWTGWRGTPAISPPGTMPRQPFVIMGQMATADPTRSAPGTESAWAYTHVPHDVPRCALQPWPSRQADRDDARPARARASSTAFRRAACSPPAIWKG